MSESVKEKIIRVATAFFAEKGYEATSVRELANEADVNVASVNYYFGSKQGLFEYLVKDFADRKFSIVVSILESATTEDEFRLRLTMFMKQFLALALDEKDSFRMVNRNIEFFSQLNPEKFEETFINTHQRFLDFITSAQQAGVIRPGLDTEMVAQILFGGLIDLVKGNEMRKCFRGLNIEDTNFFESYISTVIEVFMNGMGVQN